MLFNKIMESYRLYAMNKPFDWGSHNCVSFSLSLVYELYGKRVLLSDYKITGGTKKEFLKKLIKNKDTLSSLTKEHFGEPLYTPLLAKKGDLVLEGEGLEQNMGICYGRGIALFPKEKGLFEVPLKRCSYAWRIK